MSQLAREVFGLPIPDQGGLFDVALACHIAAGLTCVITGILAATAPKRPGRHPTVGRIFFWSLAVVFVSIVWAMPWLVLWLLRFAGVARLGVARGAAFALTFFLLAVWSREWEQLLDRVVSHPTLTA